MQHPIPAPPQQAPHYQRKGKGKLIAAIVALPLLLLASCGVGAAIGSSGEPAPAPTVTETAEPLPAETIRQDVEVTPQSCLDALDYADAAFSIFSDIMSSVQSLDAAAIEESNGQLQIILQPYLDAKAECRAAQ